MALLLLLLAAPPGDAAFALEAAYDADGDPAALLKLAEAYAAWPGHCVEARQSYERFLSACGASCEGGQEGLRALRARCVAKVEIDAAQAGVRPRGRPAAHDAGHQRGQHPSAGPNERRAAGVRLDRHGVRG